MEKFETCIRCGEEGMRTTTIDGDEWCAWCAEELEEETAAFDAENRDDEECR